MPAKKHGPPVEKLSSPIEVPEETGKPAKPKTAAALLKHYGITVAELEEILESIYQSSLEQEENQ